MYENDCIFDKFDCAISGNGQYVTTGSYNNFLKVTGRQGGAETIVEASRDPLRKRLQPQTKVQAQSVLVQLMLIAPRTVACECSTHCPGVKACSRYTTICSLDSMDVWTELAGTLVATQHQWHTISIAKCSDLLSKRQLQIGWKCRCQVGLGSIVVPASGCRHPPLQSRTQGVPTSQKSCYTWRGIQRPI